MIINFKIFEEESIEKTYFIPNNLISYFEEEKVEIWEYPWRHDKLKDFFMNLIIGKNVNFYCDRCLKKDELYCVAHSNKKHKGKVMGISFGIRNNKVILSLRLNRIKYDHQVNTDKPITIYGQIDSESKRIIDEVNLFHSIKKYNV